MKKYYINLTRRLPVGAILLFILTMGTVISCSDDDTLEEIEEELRQDAVITFEPSYFGQSFYTAPDSTHTFTVQINKGERTATEFRVYEKIISNGVLEQERTELSSFTKQLSGADDEEILIEYHVSEERKNNDKITLEFMVDQEEGSVSEALIIEVQEEEPEEDSIQELNDLIYYTQLALGGQDNAQTGSFFDVETATDFTLPEASSNQEQIDFAMLVGASTGINFLVPANSGFQYFGAEIRDAVYDGWDTKNDGEFVNIGNIDSQEVFEGLEYSAQIIEAFETAKATIGDTPGYVENENGPGDRIRQVQVGDVIFFRSESGYISVLLVTSMLPDTGGLVEFEMKTAADPNAEPQDPDDGDGGDDDDDNEDGDIAYFDAVEIGGQEHTEVGSYFNISSQSAYSLEDATANQSKIDLIMLVGASTGVNFLAPSSSGLQYFGSEIEDAVYTGWTTKNSGQFVNIGNSGTAAVFEDISSGAEMQAAFDTALAEVEDMDGYVANENGPGDRIRQVKVDDVIFFQAQDGTLIVMKINQLATDNAGSVIFEMKTVN
ncbi:hypothetical protein GCM10007103_30780 [Salinimicrobium marinum]|uniref:Uncharacterized protein n=1 Tax=Salinimicrobium marinum TaxID=680283 RepID=A0A918SKP0_9FLAO|nr:hypothetical protein [Salinimicrobium marinum]GHA47641.1 hypothetical protein GCM10007103_30780 [Salinimicrobium marinum]